MRKLAFSFLVLAALWVAPANHLVASQPLGSTQLREFFKWIKVDGNGLEFEEKLNRGFSMGNILRRQGSVWFLPYGAPLQMSYTAGALKITPMSDEKGAYFEAQCFDAVNFMATTPRARYILRPVSTPQGLVLDIE